MTGFGIAAVAVERDVSRIAAEYPALWREIRRFNLPVKLALAAAHRVTSALVQPHTAHLVALAPCRPGSAELRAISRELDAGFARGSCTDLRVNPIYTLHAIDNLALSALAIRLENRDPCACFGGAAGQAFAALEHACELLEDGRAGEVVIFGGDQSDASWRGADADSDACGAALVLTAKPARTRLTAIERRPGDAGTPRPHAARGLARWLDALAAAPPGQLVHPVDVGDGDGIDRIALVAEVE